MKLQTSVRRPEAVAAAVQNGADEILFSVEEGTLSAWSDMLAYCRLRGVDTTLNLGWTHSDADLAASAGVLSQLLRAGLSAVSLCDFGVLRAARMVSADISLQADRLFFTLGDVKTLCEMGISRVMLPPALMREQVAFIAQGASCEIGVVALGRACMALGPCHLKKPRPAAHPGEARGVFPCPEPCRRMYGLAGKADGYPLSTRDVSLLAHMSELSDIGVGCIRVDGQTPEEAALYTRLAARTIHDAPPDTMELASLARALGRAGYSDAFYMNGDALFASPEVPPPDAEARRMLQSAAESYAEGVENPRVPVRFYFMMRAGEPARLAVDDYHHHTLTVSGPIPNHAFDNALLEAEANTQFYKTHGTPYRVKSVRSQIDDDVSLPYALLHEMRREALEKLSTARLTPVKREPGAFKPGLRHLPRRGTPELTVQVASADQLSAQLVALRPALFYIPLHEVAGGEDSARRLYSLFGGDFSKIAAVLPRVMGDHEAAHVRTELSRARELGIREALCATPGQVSLALSLGFQARGDGEAGNAQTLKELKRLGLLSCLLSPELSLSQLRAFSHVIDTECIVYGRLPLLTSGRCLLKPQTRVCCCENKNELTDEDGDPMPLNPLPGHRSILYDTRKLWTADLRGLMKQLGVWAARLYFTTENPRECVQVTERHMGMGQYAPNRFTRGLFAED